MDLRGFLAEREGELVTRETLIARCWNGAPIGEDSLNRAIAGIRRAHRSLGIEDFAIETVAAAGYVLNVSPGAAMDVEAVIEASRRSWRYGQTRADGEIIENLHAAAERESDDARIWGRLALQYCRAAEYAPIEDCDRIVSNCEEAAARALALDAGQPDARVAQSSLRPLYGDWFGARRRLLAVLSDVPEHFPARHELAVLEMSTGCVSRAIRMIAGLLEEDPLAATLHYKRGYHLYCLGEHDAMDRVLDNALQLWPGHAGLWQCRTMTLAFTGRAALALEMLDDEALRPPMPPGTLEFHKTALAALADGSAEQSDRAISVLSDSVRWQSLAVAGIMYLPALGGIEQAMDLCRAYYLRDGEAPVRLRHDAAIEASINEMRRRATQALFLPVCQPLREHPKFLDLCERMGLVDYWQVADVTPDFLA